jgi:hypothetical protein
MARLAIKGTIATATAIRPFHGRESDAAPAPDSDISFARQRDRTLIHPICPQHRFVDLNAEARALRHPHRAAGRRDPIAERA